MQLGHDADVSSAIAALCGDREDPSQKRHPDLLASAVAAESVATSIAQQLKANGIQTIVTWDTPNTAVLAHIVSRELSCATALAHEQEGIVELTGCSFNEHDRTLVMSDEFETPNSLHALTGIAESRSLTVVAIAAILGTTPLDEYVQASTDITVVVAESLDP